MADDNKKGFTISEDNRYQNKDIWSNIPIDYEQSMSMGEAAARELEIIGFLDYLTHKKKNPNVRKYSIVMQGKLYYFPVDPKFEDAFFKAFTEPGGMYHEISDGRQPFLIEDTKKSTKNLLKNVLNKDKTNFLPEITPINHLKKEINFAVQNNNAELVDKLYVHAFNELDMDTSIFNIKDTREPWQLKFDSYVNEQFRIAEEERVSDAASKSTMTTVSGGGAGNAIIIEDPTNEKQHDIVFTRTPGY